MGIKADRKYEKARNELIPAAVIYANERNGAHAPTADTYTWYNAWNMSFLGEMDRMARESGLITW